MKILRGNRSVSYSNGILVSPGCRQLSESNSLPKPDIPLDIKFVNPKVNIAVIKMFPGIDGRYIRAVVRHRNIHGIVLEAYGDGSSPSAKSFFDSIEAETKKGVIVIQVNQNISSDGSESDQRLFQSGVLSGRDMTTAAAFAKLQFLLSHINDKKIIGGITGVNMRGELTPFEK